MRGNLSMVDDEVDDDCELEDKKERGAIEFLNFEGDGIMEHLFEVIWTKPHGGGVGPNVMIPDTVTFKFDKPTAWYFTKVSPKTHQHRFHKKKGCALRVGTILRYFVDRISSTCASDIVAYYISQTELSKDNDGLKPSRIHYLTKDELPHFLLHTRNKNGILQRFVNPKPSTSSTFNNCLVRCTWSQSVCLVERRTNVHLLTDKKTSRYDRAETFEGDFRNSKEHPLTSAKLLEHIQHVCARIVEHYQEVACGKIIVTNMVINFKFDPNTQLHLLWCESLRLSVKTHPMTGVALAPKPVQIGVCTEKFSLANKLELPPKTQQGQAFSRCPFCECDFSANDMVAAEYRTLLATYDEIKLSGKTYATKAIDRMRRRIQKRRQEQGGDERQGLPPQHQVPVDAHSFTQPMSTDKGLLAHIDERLLLENPVMALARAIEEWSQRQLRNDVEASLSPKANKKGQEWEWGRSCGDCPGIPWFIVQLHPYITLKDWVHVRDRDDFLGLKVSLCAFCYLGLTHGMSSQDTLKRFHRNLARKPRIERRDEIPSATLQQRKTVPIDERRQKRPGRSRLLVPVQAVFESEGAAQADGPGTDNPSAIEAPTDAGAAGSPPAAKESATAGDENSALAMDELHAALARFEEDAYREALAAEGLPAPPPRGPEGAAAASPAASPNPTPRRRASSQRRLITASSGNEGTPGPLSAPATAPAPLAATGRLTLRPNCVHRAKPSRLERLRTERSGNYARSHLLAMSQRQRKLQPGQQMCAMARPVQLEPLAAAAASQSSGHSPLSIQSASPTSSWEPVRRTVLERSCRTR
eukprot:TRINITY_DN29795_c0_g1_i1.p1 TRINITY_DN29795_c0_g1~~TRINITY_DN29795_c0_g1_i1.p1  ORF type:complete len:812 (+),score=251.78 TRINITY_DN29795_c0_g1_i1:129-2564(+)